DGAFDGRAGGRGWFGGKRRGGRRHASDVGRTGRGATLAGKTSGQRRGINARCCAAESPPLLAKRRQAQNETPILRMPASPENLRRLLVLVVLIVSPALRVSAVAAPESAASRLWYDRPAAAWVDALPIGNGRLAAMVYGTFPRERIQLNEETI